MTSLPSGTGLQILSAFAFGLILLSVVFLYLLFTQMDLTRQADFSNKLELEEDSPDDKKGYLADQDDVPKKRYLTQYRRLVLMLTVAVITILTYLILVFSNAPTWLQWLGMIIILVLLGPILQYGEEVRRGRYDRLAMLLTLVMILSTGLHLAVYAASQYADEDIYEGKARIINYQDDAYNNAEGDVITRTDLIVAWGGDWGCPYNPGQTCEATVPGALCDSGRRRRRRRVQDDGDGAADEQDGAAEDGQDGAAEDGQGDDLAASYEELKEEYDYLENQYQTLQGQYDNLQEQNENLQADLTAYENAYDELEDETEAEYYWDDDYYYDTYWDELSWDDIWGDYECEEMFEYNLDESTYDESTPPGDDGWPYLNVYGNCDTCEAFIVDFYSTEHFQEITDYKQAAVRYAVSAIFTSFLTILLAIKHRMSPAAENEIELLPSAGHGALA